MAVEISENIRKETLEKIFSLVKNWAREDVKKIFLAILLRLDEEEKQRQKK